MSFPWSTVITGVVAFAGIGYGARLTRHREDYGWTRDQRLKAYADLLTAIDQCYSAFTLVAASLVLHKYDPEARKDPRVREAIADWGNGDSAIDRCLPLAELVSSEHFAPYLLYISLGLRSRHRMLLMQLDYAGKVNVQEWESVSRMTHGEIREVRRKLRADLARMPEQRGVRTHAVAQWARRHWWRTVHYGAR